jgi:hypothetical protein
VRWILSLHGYAPYRQNKKVVGVFVTLHCVAQEVRRRQATVAGVAAVQNGACGRKSGQVSLQKK